MPSEAKHLIFGEKRGDSSLSSGWPWGLAQIFKTASVLVLCPPAERRLEITKLVLSGALHLVLLA
jgi:hypothetical protein